MARRQPGKARPPDVPPSTATGLCRIDGAPLQVNGTCSKTGGYPYGTTCPFVCPTCRQALAWDGRCHACRNYPGERYDGYFDDLQPISDGHHLHRLGPPNAVVYAVSDIPPPPGADAQPSPEPTVAQTYACALAYEAYDLHLITREVALDVYAQVFAHPEQAEDVIQFYREKVRRQRPTSRHTAPVDPDVPGTLRPQRLGDLLRAGPVIDPSIRAKLARQEASP